MFRYPATLHAAWPEDSSDPFSAPKRDNTSISDNEQYLTTETVGPDLNEEQLMRELLTEEAKVTSLGSSSSAAPNDSSSPTYVPSYPCDKIFQGSRSISPVVFCLTWQIK